MKARHTLRCECCKEPINIGSSYVVFHGRPWKSRHVLDFKARRRGSSALL